MPPRYINKIIGVIKAYTTRVGEGPFPTELTTTEGDSLRELGNEYGATTGRPRRCGWFDAIACRYAMMVNSPDLLAVTKLDVLDQHDSIKICTAYEYEGERIHVMPSVSEELSRVKPIYEEHPGWKSDTSNVRSWDDLPDNAKKYLQRISELLGDINVGIVSVGPRRQQVLLA